MTPFVNFHHPTRHTVLLIGDNLGILKWIGFALQRRGHSIISAPEGETGLRTVASERPDLVICETGLPDTSGFEVCRKIKSSFFVDLPVVLVGNQENESADVQKAYRACADDYFTSFSERNLVLGKLEWLMKRRAVAPSKRPAATRASVEHHVVQEINLN